MSFPEQLGPFNLYPPRPGADGWSMSHQGTWLPVILADRDACLLIAGLVLAESVDATDQLLVKLRDTYNQARPSMLVTVDHIVQHTAARG